MFQEQLLKWYDINKRTMPWRENHDAYRIWLSEIMLQQTQVVTVIAYFNRFIKKYPTVESMARAKEDDVLKLWEGLGYYSRARRLIPCAQIVVDQYDGRFPNDYKALLSLPGIGSYTAGAIMSIAFNARVAAVDGNVMRVYSRYFNMTDDISNSKSKTVFEKKVRETLPSDCRNYNQALMELGATVCTPKKTRCEICPIQETCQSYALDLVDQRPIKLKKIKKKTKKMVVCKLMNKGLMMIERRPPEGLLASLWGLPAYEIEGDFNETAQLSIKEIYDMDVLDCKVIKEDKHVFTHLIWEITFIECQVKEGFLTDLPENKWIEETSLKNFALPTAFKRLFGEKNEKT